jgi:hypothetical protein
MRRRVTLLLLAGLLALPGAAISPAFAQDEQTPTDLWKQYPLEEGSQPDSAVPGGDTSPRATEPERNAPKADSGIDDGGGSSLVPFVAVGAGALGAAALLLWVVPARRRRRREAGPESPAQQPAEIPSAPSPPPPPTPPPRRPPARPPPPRARGPGPRIVLFDRRPYGRHVPRRRRDREHGRVPIPLRPEMQHLT